MTKYKAINRQYQLAIRRFEEVLKLKKNDIIRDSAIKRFELVFDLAWKTIKAYLEEKKGVKCFSPKECFREAFQNQLIDQDEIWLEMTDWRNEVVHTYKEELADKLYQKLPKTLRYFKKLEEKLF